MKNEVNPFLVKTYGSAKYFCDRKKETEKLIDAAKNNRDVTLYALRRMGKTGLIEHVGAHLIKKEQYLYFYSDIYNTENSKELLKELMTNIINQLDKSKNIVQKISSIFKNIRPVISFDPITNSPQVELSLNSEDEVLHSLEELFSFVNGLNKKVYWAIDEFQQLNTYKNANNIIRKIRHLTQKSNNITFVFSGSHTNMLLMMFNKAKNPFYRSTQMLNLKEIDQKMYSKFIIKHFKAGGFVISKEAIEKILKYTLIHTWFVQMLCNRIYGLKKNIEVVDVNYVFSNILDEYQVVFYRYRQLLSKGQWALLKALAKEVKTYQPMGKKFIHTYKLSGTASIRQALHKLINDEFVVEIHEEDIRYFRVNDVFLMRWLAWKY